VFGEAIHKSALQNEAVCTSVLLPRYTKAAMERYLTVRHTAAKEKAPRAIAHSRGIVLAPVEEGRAVTGCALNGWNALLGGGS
jgi:hypothetical protein